MTRYKSDVLDCEIGTVELVWYWNDCQFYELMFGCNGSSSTAFNLFVPNASMQQTIEN